MGWDTAEPGKSSNSVKGVLISRNSVSHLAKLHLLSAASALVVLYTSRGISKNCKSSSLTKQCFDETSDQLADHSATEDLLERCIDRTNQICQQEGITSKALIGTKSSASMPVTFRVVSVNCLFVCQFETT